MEPGTKLRLGLALILTQSFMYFYLPRGGKEGRDDVNSIGVDFCKVSPAGEICFSPIVALVDLCPLPENRFISVHEQSKDDQSNDIDDVEGNFKPVDELNDEETAEKIEDSWKSENDQDPSPEETKINKKDKESGLIYQIIVVLLVVSATASLADCFQEHSKRKNSSQDSTSCSGARGGEPSLNRRMSLADLTMQRHARRESQASFRPPANLSASPGLLGFTGHRSWSTESPRKSSAHLPNRQRSCPAPSLRRVSTVDFNDGRDPKDGAWTERRRVRMIQRH